MERKYQVFISSTFEDLKEERKEVIQALLEMDCIPTGMEMFQASDDSQWELIKKVISSCDYYIVIIAGRYGSIHPITQKSYTQMEYEYASEIGIPVIAFLYRDLECLPLNKTEKNKNCQKKLQQFRELAKKRMVKFWSNKSDLASVVSRSMYQIFKSHPRNGWTRNNENLRINSANNLIIQKLDKIMDSAFIVKYEPDNQQLDNEKKLDRDIFYGDAFKDFSSHKCSLFTRETNDDKYILEYSYEIILGKLHMDFLTEISHIILTSGLDKISDFFQFPLKPFFVTTTFCSNLEELKSSVSLGRNYYFSEFNSIIPGYIVVDFHDKIIDSVNNILEKNHFTEECYFASTLYEIGNFFVSGCLTTISYFFSGKKVVPINYGLCKNIFEIISFKNNLNYLVCELSDNSNAKGDFIRTYLILNVKYIKIFCDIFNTYI